MASDKFRYDKESRWIRMEPYPGWFGVAFTKKAYKRILKKDGRSDHKTAEWLKKDAALDNFISQKRDVPFYILKINVERDPDDSQMIGLLAHEVQHALQQLWMDIGEEFPGREAEAYMMQQLISFAHYWYKRAYEAATDPELSDDPVNLTQE